MNTAGYDNRNWLNTEPARPYQTMLNHSLSNHNTNNNPSLSDQIKSTAEAAAAAADLESRHELSASK